MAEAFGIKTSVKTPKVKVTTDKKARAKALAALVKGVQASANRIESYLPAVLDKAMEASVWEWPRSTLRQNGSTVSSPRNIVDTGSLKNSLKVTTKFLKTKTTFNITYTAGHAAIVHEGGYIIPYGNKYRSPVYIPGRPWIPAAIEGGVSGVEALDIQNEFLNGVTGAW